MTSLIRYLFSSKYNNSKDSDYSPESEVDSDSDSESEYEVDELFLLDTPLKSIKYNITSDKQYSFKCSRRNRYYLYCKFKGRDHFEIYSDANECEDDNTFKTIYFTYFKLT